MLKDDCKTDYALIPGGLTSIIDLLDCLNKPLKDKLQQKLTPWMILREKNFYSWGSH